MATQNDPSHNNMANNQYRPQIDFYRQQDNQQQPYSRETRMSKMILKYNFSLVNKQYESEAAGYRQGSSSNEPSPINGYNQSKLDPANDNFMVSSSRGFSSSQEKINSQEMNRQTANKRRSIESKEVIQNTRSRDLLIQQDYQPQAQFQRTQTLGTKSAMSNYGPLQSQQLSTAKQINKQTKVEKDPVMLLDQQTLFSQQQSKQRSLAKSQSQNKLMLVSPDTFNNKANPYQDIYEGGAIVQDKNSFYKTNGGNQAQDLLYKQHMQYSSGGQKGWHLKASSQNMLLSRMTHKSECTFCNKTTAGAISQSQIPHHCSAIYCQRDQQGMTIQNYLSKKYSTNRDYYNLKIVNDLIYNENTHVVSIFKDFLILDDINEFLKRSYTVQETKVRLPKLCSFYDKYSQVFPNYVVLPESKYMFKNIQRKQKLIDEQYQLQEELAKKQHITLLDEDKLFNSKFYNSYYSNMGDISMTKKQYEEQAKQIATQAGKTRPIGRIDQMRIDELVDRFLMKDSESNIQLITTAGLDFSGFTQQNSTFINQHQTSVPIASDQKTKQPLSKQVVQQVPNKIQQKSVPQKKMSEEKKKPQNLVLAQSTVTTGGLNTKRQKNSFNQSGKSNVVPKLDTLKIAMSNNDSTKNTPRLQQQKVEVIQKQTIQTSPQTKEAILNYLHNCQIEPHTEPNHQHAGSLGPLISPGSQGNYLESPSIKSPNAFGQKNMLQTSGSLTSLQQNLNQNRQSRQNLKSQSAIPTIQLGSIAQTQQQITNLKKATTRLSNGGAQKISQQRKNASPGPISQQQAMIASRNGNIASNSTQKSNKSINSHAKYLSGGNEQYQKLLMGINTQGQLVQQNSYQTNYETINSHLAHSSSKKHIHNAAISNKESSSKKLNFQQRPHYAEFDVGQEGATVTNEDCDDFGIADERFASPELVFHQTIDENNRRSIEPQYAMLLTSQDDKILQQANNYDQIKKHLEQCIGPSTQKTFDHRAVTKSNNMLTRSNEKGSIYEENKGSGYNRDKMAQSVQSNNNINQNSQDQSRNGTGQKHFESLKQKIRGVFDNNHLQDNQSIQSIQTIKTPSKQTKKNTSSSNQHLILQNRMSLDPQQNMIILMPNSNTSQQHQLALTSTSANGRQMSFSQTQNSQNYRSITNIQQRKGSNQGSKNDSSVENKRMSGQPTRQSFKDQQSAQQHVQTVMKEQQKIMKRCATGKTLSIQEINAQSGYMPSGSSTSTLCNPTFISSTSTQNIHNTKMYSSTAQNTTSMSQHQQQQAANTVRVMTPSYSLASLSKMISPASTNGTSPMTGSIGNQQVIGRKQLATNQNQKKHPSNHHMISSNSAVLNQNQHTYLVPDGKGGQKLIQTQGSVTGLSNSSKGIISSKSGQKQAKTQSGYSQINPTPPPTTGMTLSATLNQKIGRQNNLIIQQSNSLQSLHQVTPRGINQQMQPQQMLMQSQQNELAFQKRPPQQIQVGPPTFEASNLSCTISTENNSSKFILLNIQAAKAIESKHPKFMSTIDEYANAAQPQYNTMLSASMGQHSRKGMMTSASQAQLEMVQQKQKIQTVVNSNQSTVKRSQGGQTLITSASVSHFKSPSTHIQPGSKKQLQTRYLPN